MDTLHGSLETENSRIVKRAELHLQMYEGNPRSELYAGRTTCGDGAESLSEYTICNYMHQGVNTAHLTSRIRTRLASSTQGAVATKLVVFQKSQYLQKYATCPGHSFGYAGTMSRYRSTGIVE